MRISMTRLPALLFAALLFAAVFMLAGCATPRPGQDAEALTFVVVRHAEKATDDPEDPRLSEAGRQRAQRLATLLAGDPVVAVYATEFRRTRETGQPTAEAHHVPISAYFSRGPADESAARWRRDHDHGTVVIVGHSNTVPDLVTALSGQTTTPMPETEYDRVTRIRFDADGRARVEITRY
ncbi:SixA phosphatase family protein [Pseudoxanthomonas beigongshangi]